LGAELHVGQETIHDFGFFYYVGRIIELAHHYLAFLVTEGNEIQHAKEWPIIAA
jgi:hypothetical protein